MVGKWSFGVLNDKVAEDVPGTVLLLAEFATQPALFSNKVPSDAPEALEKRTSEGILLSPSPDESPNDPLNWPLWRRNIALLALGIYCMLGGGMTPLLAAGFQEVAHTFHVGVPKVALTTGFFMLGLGIGSVFVMPTAILFGKRPLYLTTAVVFFVTSIWCAVSSSYTSLVLARIFQGISVSPVECLPSSTITEIFFLHERAFRLGIYTLLLLSGKNLMPLVSAVVIQGMGWRSVFWSVAIAVGCCAAMLFFGLPESFWDRSQQQITSGANSSSDIALEDLSVKNSIMNSKHTIENTTITVREVAEAAQQVDGYKTDESARDAAAMDQTQAEQRLNSTNTRRSRRSSKQLEAGYPDKSSAVFLEYASSTPSPTASNRQDLSSTRPSYTDYWRAAPKKSYVQCLAPYSGRISPESWTKAAIRPFILFAYPSVLWSALVYSMSVGWLIVLSESVSAIYRNSDTYNFTSFQVGLVYLSAFTGGVLGTALAGKASDFIVRFMAKRNNGVFEPEFRLVMALPVAISSVAGLMGFGWSVEEHDNWIVPTVFFGIISFGCSLGSTTAITFCVDSYRQYAGEALVTLNFSKNIFHGLLFSLFFPEWLEKDGSKRVFMAIGFVQLGCLLFTIPMFIYGKRARMWTVRKNMIQ